jgi:hypothetical protein
MPANTTVAHAQQLCTTATSSHQTCSTQTVFLFKIDLAVDSKKLQTHAAGDFWQSFFALPKTVSLGRRVCE